MIDKTKEDFLPTVSAMNNGGAFSNISAFEDALRMVKPLTRSTLVPKHFQGDEGVANAVIALEMAQRIGASPLMIMQNLYVVHGNPGWSAQFIIAALNGCGRYEPLEFHMVGEEGTPSWGCYVTAISKKAGSVLKGPTVTMKMAHDEGWVNKNGSKWKTMPEVMLRYRSASFFGKNYAPDILMGMQSVEELYDIGDQEASKRGSKAASVMDKVKEKDITPPTYAEIVDMINNAQTLEEAQAAEAMASHLPDQQQAEIGDIIFAKFEG